MTATTHRFQVNGVTVVQVILTDPDSPDLYFSDAVYVSADDDENPE